MADEPGKSPPPDSVDEIEQPLIRFGQNWIPAHLAWKKMETASVVADIIEHFNSNFPHLATQLTRDTVSEVRQRLKDVQLHVPERKQAPDLGSIAQALLQSASPEDVLDQLANQHQQTLSLRELISLTGQDAYLSALRREAVEYEQNRILPEQTAQIWNEMSRPAPGGGLWNLEKVQQLIG